MVRRTLPNVLIPAFGAAALAILTACALVIRSQAFGRSPDVAAWGVTLDLTVTIPLVYYLLVVRNGRAKPLTIAPVAVAGMLVASLIVPRDHQSLLHQLRFAAMPLEVLTIALAFRRLRRGSDDRLTRLIVSEAQIVRYAITGWFAKREAAGDARPITVHEQSGYGSIVACIVVLVVSESIGMHLLLQMWSAKAAWIVTALDVYGILWILGDYHALRLRPSLLHPHTLELRHGLRWSAMIARDNIAAVTPIRSEFEWRRKGVLKLALFDEPRYLIQLREPVVARGIAGITRVIDAIAIRPDDEEAVEELVPTK